jgi:hypothetical protein
MTRGSNSELTPKRLIILVSPFVQLFFHVLLLILLQIEDGYLEVPTN